jgi:hypothetical protein
MSEQEQGKSGLLALIRQNQVGEHEIRIFQDSDQFIVVGRRIREGHVTEYTHIQGHPTIASAEFDAGNLERRKL